jgi:HK97 family phage prohead protease
MKNNFMSLSFGYVTTKGHKRSDGVQVLEELDLFEISICPVPANPDTRILAMKSMDDSYE